MDHRIRTVFLTALLALAALPAAVPARAGALPFIEDDYAQALARALARLQAASKAAR